VEPSHLELLRKDEEFVLYRGRHSNQPGSQPVLLLSPASIRPPLETLKKIEHEYSLRDELDSAWAVRPLALSEQRGQTTLVLEDPGGETLDRFLLGPMEMTRFLRFAVGLATALGRVHESGLIHKDIKPANVLVNPATGQVRLMGFGIASRLPRERQAAEPPEFIAGTLPYMAPEQTGRMNRSIDSRSDLYALGVTLYEMLTGTLPFSETDPMKLVYSHIARQPVPPGDRLPGIPQPVSAIIMKLLAKTAEERYQTAAGAASDLGRCLAEWETQHRIDEFPLGEQDTPDRLLIPEKLYGRESEIAALLAAFDRVVAGGRPELVLVSGYSGIGKSSVVNELHKRLVPPRGLFASGKFDQYKRDIPYATLAQAFQSLLRPLLTKSEPELSKWRDALREALDPNGQLIVDLVPELKFIIGEQPPVPEVPPQDAQGRFQLVFRRFIGVFSRPEHPLALFLDDLQWLDAATLDLLEDLLTRAEAQHLMLIGAYRDNEVNSAHPLMRKLEAIRQAGPIVLDIVLAPLVCEDLGRLIADSLHVQLGSAAPLAQVIHEKTAGNPFFAIQFISELAEEGLLTFDHGEGRWSWDLSRIHAKEYTDNVVDLIVGKMNRMPVNTQNALQQLACLGNSADFVTLRMVYEDSNEEMHGQLWEAVRAGLIFRSKDSYRFLHDRVQEAAYSLIPEQLRTETHLRIGRLLAAHIPPDKREEAIFEIVNQLNRGAPLITSRDEREQLAELNLIAGKRAKASTAYASALNYLTAGAAMLDDSWERRHDLAFLLELHRAECEFLTSQPTAAEERLTMLSSRAANTVELANVTSLRVDLYTSLDQSDQAVAVSLDYLRHLGEEWSPHPTEEVVKREYERIWSQLGSRKIEELINLPLMSDPASLATLDVLTKVLPPALFTDANLLSLAICRAVNLSIERGNRDGSCVAYGWLGQVAGPHFGDYKAGFRFGRLGYELVEKRGLKRFEARIYTVFASHVMPWTKHVRAGRDMLHRTFEAANKNGDLVFAVYSWLNVNTNLLAAGDPLGEVQREAENGLEFAQKTRFGFAIDHFTARLGLIRTLRGSTPEFGCFDDGQFKELVFERHLASDQVQPQPVCFYWIRKLQARFFAGDYTSALDASLKAQVLLWTAPSNLEISEYHLYGGLCRATSWDSASPDQKRKHFEALAAHHRQLEIWAENCPENFENRAVLLGAEIARIEGRVLDAEGLYEKAIRSARANGFIHNEAIAYEVGARFYATRGFDKFADAYLQEARYCYLRWGADGKVNQLDHLYPHLKKGEPAPGPTSTIVAPVEILDLTTVTKVSQAVSGDMVLEKLIDRVMCAAIEHAGAERGLLIFPRGDELQIEAEATTSGNNVTVQLRDETAAGAALPDALVRYVMRTHENVILNDASRANPFSADPYIVQHRARSVLCIPLINQAQLIGVLYLENSLTPHVFTPDRITVLKVIASQAAISLENTRLYRDLEDREAKIRRLVDANILGIFIWKFEGAIVGANEAFLRMLQYDREDLVSGRLRWTDMTPAEWHERDECALAELKATGTVQPYEKEFFQKHGSRVPVLAGAALFEEGGNDGVAFVLDLSEQKRAEAEIRALKDQLYRENLALRDEVDRASMFEEIVGASKPLKGVLSRIAKVASTDSTVFITGETGTGKELIARAVHKRSQRSGRAFVSVNCAALAPTLISSELFGHEKGAFTGAAQRRLGRFELADGGTIFLDEVGELLPDTQVALLRVLQEREFERVGGGQPIHVDVRVIAATNRDLKAAIANGAFRQDLFYRLNVFPIDVPPLRERNDDILMLVEYFARRYGSRMGKNIRSIDKKTLGLLQSYDWPGNIRELQNVIERSVILSSGDVLSVDELWLSEDISRPALRVEALAAFKSEGEPWDERETIEAALAETRGRVSGPSGAAAKLGIPPSTLDHRIKALKINRNRFKFG
jgi:PAS domain S-box-containing protein